MHASCVLLQFDGRIVASGSLDTTIRIWNVDTGECMHTLLGHHSLTSGMQLLGDLLVSGNADSTVKVWNVKDGSCLHTLNGKTLQLSLLYNVFTMFCVCCAQGSSSIRVL